MTFIPLKDWAEKNGIGLMDAKNLARNGNLGKSAKKKKVTVDRWFVEEGTKAVREGVRKNGKVVLKWKIS